MNKLTILINGVVNWGDDHTTLVSPVIFILAGAFQQWIQKCMKKS